MNPNHRHLTSRVGAEVSGGYLGSGVAALLEARLATQCASQRGGVMVQTETGARHDGGLEMPDTNIQSQSVHKTAGSSPEHDELLRTRH